ncbi:MAG: hypothetical protein FWG36_00045 [Oscillospiraceae bacterium]|nr:hypothetical protein [Oscillospiraceae bacterium]
MGKIIKICCLLFVICYLLSACWDKTELEDATYVILLGLDRADSQDIGVTVAFPLSQQMGGDKEMQYTVMSVKAPNVTEGINLLAAKIAGSMSLNTVKTVIISRELAESGELRQTLSSRQFIEVRNTANICVADCTAAEFIKARIENPLIDTLRQEDLLLEQSSGSLLYRPLELLDLKEAVETDGACASMLGGVVKQSGEDNNNDDDKQEDKKGEKEAPIDGDNIKMPVRSGYTAGKVPIRAENETQICGLAVFKDGKMVGTLDSDEAQTYTLLTRGKAQKTLIMRGNGGDRFSVLLRPAGRRQVSCRLDGGILVFDIRLNLRYESDLPGIDENIIAEAAAGEVRALLNRLQREFDADILGFEGKVRRHFGTQRVWDEYSKNDWFRDAVINVEICIKKQ